MPVYLFTARKRLASGFGAEPGPIQYLCLPDEAPTYGPEHVVPVGRWLAELRERADGDPGPTSISPAGDILVFVHGYNNTMAEVVARTKTLEANLRGHGWRGVVVGFDWPSGNSVLNYAEDRSDAAAVAGQLVSRGLRLLMPAPPRRGPAGEAVTCQTNVHLLGHSTGAYVILEAFAQAEKSGELFRSDWRIGQVALIAGDVAASSLAEGAEWSQPLFRRIMRLTNYSNGSDAVLAVSNAKRLGVSPRAGRVGLPEAAAPKAVNVDCTEHFHGLTPPEGAGLAWCHGWHFADPRFGLDLALTLEGAMDRHVLPTRSPGPRGAMLNETGTRPPGMALWGIKAASRG